MPIGSLDSVPTEACTLCLRCKGLLFQIHFHIEDTFAELHVSASCCSLCKLLLGAVLKYCDSKSGTFGFRKVGSGIVLEDHSDSTPILSICSRPGKHETRMELVQKNTIFGPAHGCTHLVLDGLQGRYHFRGPPIRWCSLGGVGDPLTMGSQTQRRPNISFFRQAIQSLLGGCCKRFSI